MADEKSIADVLHAVLKGRRLSEQVGDWHISNLHCLSAIDLTWRDDAVYGFMAGVAEDTIQFYNHHREARRGTGTPTLRQIESAFRTLAERRGQDVCVAFDLFGQEDTKAWLLKNGYSPDDQDTYRKTIRP